MIVILFILFISTFDNNFIVKILIHCGHLKTSDPIKLNRDTLFFHTHNTKTPLFKTRSYVYQRILHTNKRSMRLKKKKKLAQKESQGGEKKERNVPVCTRK